MRYAFKNILDNEVYENSKVIFVFGKYNVFNNLVSDEFKAQCIEKSVAEISVNISAEFGFKDEEEVESNSVDFNTFLNVIGVPSINGKWFCSTSLGVLNKKQKEALINYIKSPSNNGILVVSSTDWLEYKDFLKNKTLLYSKNVNMIQLNYAHRDSLKVIVKSMFESKNLNLDQASIDFFIMRMSSQYDEYENIINDILTKQMGVNGGDIGIKDMRGFMKGIENYIIDDFVDELMKPLSNDETGNKKILRVMATLIEEMGAKNLIYQLLRIVEDRIELRMLINKGIIPIGINYFFADVIKNLGEDSKFAKKNEWMFRREVERASMTSLRDWEYMKLMLSRPLENLRIDDKKMEQKCFKALYEICTRSVLKPNRINNIIGIEDIMKKRIQDIDKLKITDRRKS